MFFDYLILAGVLGAIAVSLLYSWITGISPVSSTFKSRKRIIKTIAPDQDGFIRCRAGAMIARIKPEMTVAEIIR